MIQVPINYKHNFKFYGCTPVFLFSLPVSTLQFNKRKTLLIKIMLNRTF